MDVQPLRNAPVFTEGNPQATATVSEPVEYTVPEGWGCDETEMGIVLTAPWGWTYAPNELLEGKENPQFHVINKDGDELRIELNWRNLQHYDRAHSGYMFMLYFRVAQGYKIAFLPI